MAVTRKPRGRFVKFVVTILVTMLALSMLEVISVAVLPGRKPSVQMVGPTRAGSSASDDLVLYFPALGADPARSYDVLRPVLPSVPAMAVRYAPQGYEPEVLFPYLDQMIRVYAQASHRTPRLILVGVSFGAGVALRYRMHQKALAKQDQVQLPPVRFVLYSPVVAGVDLKWTPRLLGLAAKVLRGGVVSQGLWNAFHGSHLLYPADPIGNAETDAEVLRQRRAGLDAYPLSLLSSQLRTMRGWPELGRGSMGDDTALIFGFRNDGSLTSEALARTAALFAFGSIVELAEAGHADMERVTTVIGPMGPPIKRFLERDPDTPETR